MNPSGLVLVVEDSPSAIKSIRESLEVMGVPHRIMSQVDEVDRFRITGWIPGEDEGPFSLAWGQVRILFCDYQIGGSFSGGDVVENASFGGAGLIIGMSSCAGFNRRMLAAGAQIAEEKHRVIHGIGSGRWPLT